MGNFFTKIKTDLKNPSPSEFLNYLKEKSIRSYQGYLLFEGLNLFENNLNALISDITLEPATIQELQVEQNFKIVAQTIDGDFLASMTEETWIIPKNLIVNDIERYPLQLLDFLIQFEQGQIESKILSRIS